MLDNTFVFTSGDSGARLKVKLFSSIFTSFLIETAAPDMLVHTILIKITNANTFFIKIHLFLP